MSTIKAKVQPETLSFSGDFSQEQTQTTQVSGDGAKKLIFKVRSTRPDRFHVRPVFGILRPGKQASHQRTEVSISVRLNRQEQALRSTRDRVSIYVAELPLAGKPDKKLKDLWDELKLQQNADTVNVRVPIRYHPQTTGTTPTPSDTDQQTPSAPAAETDSDNDEDKDKAPTAPVQAAAVRQSTSKVTSAATTTMTKSSAVATSKTSAAGQSAMSEGSGSGSGSGSESGSASGSASEGSQESGSDSTSGASGSTSNESGSASSREVLKIL